MEIRKNLQMNNRIYLGQNVSGQPIKVSYNLSGCIIKVITKFLAISLVQHLICCLIKNPSNPTGERCQISSVKRINWKV